MAGTGERHIKVATPATLAASPRASRLMATRSVVTKDKNTATMIIAAAVMTRPGRPAHHCPGRAHPPTGETTGELVPAFVIARPLVIALINQTFLNVIQNFTDCQVQ
jgi:hypothetical protein